MDDYSKDSGEENNEMINPENSIGQTKACFILFNKVKKSPTEALLQRELEILFKRR